MRRIVGTESEESLDRLAEIVAATPPAERLLESVVALRNLGYSFSQIADLCSTAGIRLSKSALHRMVAHSHKEDGHEEP